MKLKREQEQKEIEDIEQREKELLEDCKKTEEPTDDHYTTLRVKKAQLMWTYIDTEKKMKQMCGLIAKTRREIEELDEKYPDLKQSYFNKYMDARKKAGIKDDITMNDNTFIKYLVDDIKIKNIDDEYDRIYNS
jgi:hypothetical protein